MAREGITIEGGGPRITFKYVANVRHVLFEHKFNDMGVPRTTVPRRQWGGSEGQTISFTGLVDIMDMKSVGDVIDRLTLLKRAGAYSARLDDIPLVTLSGFSNTIALTGKLQKAELVYAVVAKNGNLLSAYLEIVFVEWNDYDAERTPPFRRVGIQYRTIMNESVFTIASRKETYHDEKFWPVVAAFAGIEDSISPIIPSGTDIDLPSYYDAEKLLVSFAGISQWLKQAR